MFTSPALKWFVTSNTHNLSYLSHQVQGLRCIPNSVIFNTHNYILGGELEPPTAILWVYHFLAQHFDYLRDSKRAMEYINKALEHTPTLIEAYMVKARIYKVLTFFPAYSVPKRLVEPELQLWATHNHVNPVSGIRKPVILTIDLPMGEQNMLRSTSNKKQHWHNGLTSDEK